MEAVEQQGALASGSPSEGVGVQLAGPWCLHMTKAVQHQSSACP